MKQHIYFFYTTSLMYGDELYKERFIEFNKEIEPCECETIAQEMKESLIAEYPQIRQQLLIEAASDSNVDLPELIENLIYCDIYKIETGQDLSTLNNLTYEERTMLILKPNTKPFSYYFLKIPTHQAFTIPNYPQLFIKLIIQ